MKILWLDDTRPVPSKYFVHDVYAAQTYEHAVKIFDELRKDKDIIVCDLDHDLGQEKSGYDFCKMIVENQIPCDEVAFVIHSMNPVGRSNMAQLLSHYGYHVG